MNDQPTDPDFSIQDALKVQSAMRASLGLPPERFPVPAFVGMLSDEIEKLRDAGKSDSDIAELVHRETGRRIDPADIARHYAPPDQRQHG